MHDATTIYHSLSWSIKQYINDLNKGEKNIKINKTEEKIYIRTSPLILKKCLF